MSADSRPIHFSGPVATLAAVLVALAAIGFGRWLRTRAFAPAAAQSPLPMSQARSSMDRGEILFHLHCAKCHGPEGHGDPEALARQRPPPRDFASRPWRFEVSRESIRRVTTEGIPQTAMPAHRAALSDEDLQAVADYTYRLANLSQIAAVERSPLEQHLLAAGFTIEPASQPAPELSLLDASNNERSLADERGRLVILNFWGTSCEHCLANMPKLQSLADRHLSSGLSVLNVCADAPDAESAQRLAAQASPGTQVWIDSTGLANSQFEVHALPTIWLIDPAGNLLASARGSRDWDSPAFTSLVRYLLSVATSGQQRPSLNPK